MADTDTGETEVSDWSQLPSVVHQGLFSHTQFVCQQCNLRALLTRTDTLQTEILEGAGKPSPFRFLLPLLSHTLSLYAGRLCQYFSALSYSLGLQSA